MIIKEKERKLLVSSEKGEKIIEKVRKLDKAGDFILQGMDAFSIQDVYLDNKDFRLAKAKGYLRLRGKESGHLMVLRTIKDSQIDEVSHPLSDEGIRLILSLLAENYSFRDKPKFILPTISEIFHSMGLNEVLRSAVERVERSIYMEDVLIGKLKIDSFRYLFPNEIGPFYEVEVDSYKKALHTHMDTFIAELLKIFREVMEPSLLSKYIRGVNIAYGLNL